MENTQIKNNDELLSSMQEVNKLLHTLSQKNAEAEKKYDSLVENVRTELSSKIADNVAEIQKFKSQQSLPSFENKGSDYKATADFLRKGIGGDHNNTRHFSFEKKDLSVADHELGGYLVYPAYGDVALALQRLQSPVRQHAKVIPFSIGDSIVIPRWFNNSTSSFNVEGGSNSSVEATTGEVRIVANEITATHTVSSKLLEDAVYPVETLLAEELFREFAEKESNAFINGDGVNEPRGILTYGTQATEVTTPVKAFYTINSGAATTYTHAGLVNTWANLRQSYATNAKWYASRGGLAGIVRVADTQNLPLYGNQSGIGKEVASGFTLFGKEVVVLEHMPALAASSKSLFYGDLSRCYAIAEKPIQSILRNPFRSDNKVSFQGRRRVGGDVVAFDAIILVNTAV